MRKGKQYISQKAPADIAFMYADGRYRLSTVTSDEAVAKAKAQEYLRKIEDHFDRSRMKLDPFIEGVRPYLESKGVDVVQWYKQRRIEFELYRNQTLLWRMTGGNYEFNKLKQENPDLYWSADVQQRMTKEQKRMGRAFAEQLEFPFPRQL